MTKKNDDLLSKLLAVGGTKPTKTFYMKRFDADFKLQSIDYKLLQRLREQATFPVPGKKNESALDEVQFGMLIIANGVIDPNLNDMQIVAQYGSAIDAVQELFLPGEISRLSGEIMALSGYADSEDEIKD
jgi:hypothetical protein